jgi:hypothetical protein
LKVERRDFLLLRAGQPAVLSCEQLFMRYLDSQMDGTTAQLFEHLAGDLRGVPAVRLTETTWLANADLRDQINPILKSFKAGGGRIF